jgi:uncharacterized protein YkwD
MSSGLRLFEMLLLSSLVGACAATTAQPSDDAAELTTSSADATTSTPKQTQRATLPKPGATYDCSANTTSRAEQVCQRWYCDGDGGAKAVWHGDSATCNPGDLDTAAADNALQRINVHRFLAGLEPFTADPELTGAAQDCALIAHANKKLSHEPPPSWSCWSTAGASISEGSLVANVSLAPSIAAYIEDPGNEPTMVHRRWLLDETLSSVGFGTTDHYSCVVVDGRSMGKPPVKPKDARGWAAWPPAGPVPFDVFASEKLDTAGWTVQSMKNDLEGATVQVTLDGKNMPVAVTQLTAGQGSRSAIRFVPQGWVTEAGRSYAVAVKGSAADIRFEVQPVGCGQ